MIMQIFNLRNEFDSYVNYKIALVACDNPTFDKNSLVLQSPW